MHENYFQGKAQGYTYLIFFGFLILFVFFFILALCFLLLSFVFLLFLRLPLFALQLLFFLILFLDLFNLSIEFILLLLGFKGCNFLGIGLTKSPIKQMSRTYVEEVLWV